MKLFFSGNSTAISDKHVKIHNKKTVLKLTFENTFAWYFKENISKLHDLEIDKYGKLKLKKYHYTEKGPNVNKSILHLTYKKM